MIQALPSLIKAVPYQHLRLGGFNLGSLFFPCSQNNVFTRTRLQLNCNDFNSNHFTIQVFKVTSKYYLRIPCNVRRYSVHNGRGTITPFSLNVGSVHCLPSSPSGECWGVGEGELTVEKHGRPSTSQVPRPTATVLHLTDTGRYPTLPLPSSPQNHNPHRITRKQHQTNSTKYPNFLRSASKPSRSSKTKQV